MPNNSYLRSTKRERQIVNSARKGGMIAARSAGSHSPVDCWIWDEAQKTLHMIQVKTKRGKRYSLVKNEKVFKDCEVRSYTLSWEK